MSNAILILGVVYCMLLLVKACLALACARALPAAPVTSLAPGSLTIAQAILSGDPLLESLLETNLKAHEGQDFIWLVDDNDVEAKRVVELLQAKYPTARVTVEICPPCPDAMNPKLWKLCRSVPLVKTPIYCVLDDDTTLSTESAATLAARTQDHTVATGLPCYLHSGDLPSALLSQFVNNNSVFTYLATSRLLAPFTLNGMGYMVSSGELPRLGGFEPVLNELTDDLAVATLVLKRGGRIHQSEAPLRVQTGVQDLRHYFQLMHRWYVFTILLMQRQSIPVQMIIFGLHGLPTFLFAFLVVLVVMTASGGAWMILAGVLGLRLVVITSMHRRFFGSRLHHPLLSVLSELLQPVHLFHAAACRTIRWRTHRYRVRDTNDFFDA